MDEEKKESAHKTHKKRWQPCPNNLLYFTSYSLFPHQSYFLTLSLSPLASRERKREETLFVAKALGEKREENKGVKQDLERDKEVATSITTHQLLMDMLDRQY